MSSHSTPPYKTLSLESFNDEDALHDHDLEGDAESDTTLASDSFLKHRTSSSSRSDRYERRIEKVSTFLTWFRWSIIVFLQGVIVILLLPSSGVLTEGLGGLTGKYLGGQRLNETLKDGTILHSGVPAGGWSMEKTEAGADINGIYIPTSHQYTILIPEEEKFVPNMTTNDTRMEIRRNWDMLMPLGSGSVTIPDFEAHPLLGKPIMDDPLRAGINGLYEASWTHALHCLYYTVDSYHQLVLSNATKFGFDGERNDYHAAHCFEYLRNQIMCMGDMTLEGSKAALGASNSEGQAHVCRDRGEAVRWIEDRRVDDIRSVVGP